MPRINVILDLDNTLISAVDSREAVGMKESYRRASRLLEYRDMLSDGGEFEYRIFARPGLQPFLDWLFTHFNVSVWTAASKNYAMFIVSTFITRPTRKLDYVLFSHHCDLSRREANNKAKCLELLGTSPSLPIGYDPDKTYIIDDHAQVYACQPNRCIRVAPFDVTKRINIADSTLEAVRRKLDVIRLNSADGKQIRP